MPFGFLKNWFKKEEEEITEQDIEIKTKECTSLFDELHLCVARHGWNDALCAEEIRPKYDECLKQRDKMQAKFYESYS